MSPAYKSFCHIFQSHCSIWSAVLLNCFVDNQKSSKNTPSPSPFWMLLWSKSGEGAFAWIFNLSPLYAPTSSFRIKSIVCIHHVYKAVWSSYIREELLVQFEVDNKQDDFAVAISWRTAWSLAKYHEKYLQSVGISCRRMVARWCASLVAVGADLM